MAKSSKPTNAFGMTPDSFETPKKLDPGPIMKPENIQVTAPEAAVQVETKPAAKKGIPLKERNTERIHFMAKKSLVEQIDAYAAEYHVTRTDIMETAIKLFLETYYS